MLNIFKTKSAILSELGELRVQNGVMRGVIAAQLADLTQLREEVRDREALLRGAYEHLATVANKPKRDGRGRFVGGA